MGVLVLCVIGCRIWRRCMKQSRQAIYRYDEVDIRLAVGEPHGDTPIMQVCPMHEDDTGSLAVYRKNLHCFGCGFHLKRRYSSLAWLLGLWDGETDEDGMVATTAGVKMKRDLGKYTNGQ